ncbi:porin [Duodenibacillus massiliensis]|uniref:porin n=1 Tax=Duodenibacillus massiliensis TaxID=1852381 RepID=UPI00093E292D|nr:porin [Duodenibacillus massiliensis]
MKKTLAAVAVLGAFAGSAVAADVTLYGLVDYGVRYQNLDADKAGVDKTNKVDMKSGANSGSRFGLKGTEDLGNGVKVGFVLENGFDADTGALGDKKGNRLFDREAQLFVDGSFGRVSFGRVGQLASANGSYGLLGVTGPFSTGYGDATSGLKFVGANGFTRFDNTITYMTPSFGGLTVYAQYSSSVSSSGTENESDTDRAYGIGAKFVGAGLTLVGVVDSTNYQSFGSGAVSKDMDDALTVTLGGNYDFQVAKVYFGGQYFDNAKTVATTNVIDDANKAKIGTGYTLGSLGAEGWGLGLGVGVPVMGGTASAYAGYLDADSVDDSDASLKRFTGAVGYSYTFSKRTSMYSTLSYTKDEYKANGTADKVKPTSVEAIVGLIHKF